MYDLAAETEKYREVWRDESGRYRQNSPGQKAVVSFLEGFHWTPGETLLDAGCGTGRGGAALRAAGLLVYLMDLVPECLDERVREMVARDPAIEFVEGALPDIPDEIGPVDWIYCCDVLEHLAEEAVAPSIAALAARARRGGVIQVATFKSEFLGHQLHLTLQGANWWRERVEEHFRITAEIAPTGEAFQQRPRFLVEPLEVV